MKHRLTPTLFALTAALALGEFGSAILIWRENQPDAQPWFAVLFGVLFLTAAALVRGRRIVAGAVLAGVLCLFEVANYPVWQKHGALDWAVDSVYAVVSLAGLAVAVGVLATRVTASRRSPARTTR